LARYLRSWQWAKANRAEAQRLLKSFCSSGGLNISDEAIKKEFSTRPTCSLNDQIALIATPPASDSKYEFALQRMGIFLRESGVIASTRPAQQRITDNCLKLNPHLKAIATSGK
jgi:ABC-type nitrate/sulfonate/bicarbonate transport system substrate-binding protein